MPQAGTIIFLNGTSSAGKTTLAHALQERLVEPYIHMALDQFRDSLPDKFRGLNAPTGTTGDRGLNVVPITFVEKPYTEVRFGTDGERMLRGMRRAMASMVAEGNNIIIDDILLKAEFLDDYLTVFAGLNAYLVGVRCPVSEIQRRERARPGRFPGTAIGHFEACHAHGVYDIEVDTSEESPALCATKIIRHIQANAPYAMTELRREASVL